MAETGRLRGKHGSSLPWKDAPGPNDVEPNDEVSDPVVRVDNRGRPEKLLRNSDNTHAYYQRYELPM